MESIAPAASRHQPPGELVDNDHLAVLDHVVDVTSKQRVGTERLVDVVKEGHVGGVVEPSRLQTAAQELLGPGHAAFSEGHGLVFFVFEEVARRLQGLPFLSGDIPLRDRPWLQLRMIRSTSA